MPESNYQLFEETPVPSGPGIREENIHQGSGLRIQTVTASLSSSIAGFYGGTGVFLSALSLPGNLTAQAWTSIKPALATAWIGRLPVPMTPTLSMQLSSTGTTPRFRIRMRGFDQFGTHIAEVSPWFEFTGIDVAGSRNGFLITMSKVFSYVDDIELMPGATGDITNATFVEPGWIIILDPSGAEGAGAANFFGTGVSTKLYLLGTQQNWAIGSPLRISPYAYDPFPATFAGGILTFAANAANAETVTLDTQVYTWKTTLTGAPNEVLVGASAAASAQNLYDAVNYTGTPGTQYSAVTVRHQTMRASAVTATTVTFTSRLPGSFGNTLATTETMANGSFAATTLNSGIDSPQSRNPEILGASGILLRQKTTPTIINQAAMWPTYGVSSALTGVILGRSAPPASAVSIAGITYTYGPWQGTAHKIGFQSSDAFATAPFEVNGSSQRASNQPTTQAQLSEDEFFWSFTIRSHLGTRRDSVPGGSYPR